MEARGGNRWRITGGTSEWENRAVEEQSGGPGEEEGRFGGEGFPDEAQLTARTYSALMTGLTTSTR